MAALPAEIIDQILLRSPVKSLLCFKCVCKSWNSLIKSPNFIKLHLNQTLISNSDHHLFLISSKDFSLHSAEIDTEHNNLLSFSDLHHPLENQDNGFYYVLGSCNGVVCITDDCYHDVILTNPLTNSKRKLRISPSPNPDNTILLFGFGYDSKSDDYKVLRMMEDEDSESPKTKAQVYSLSNNSWRSVEGIPYYLYYNYFHGILVNEALHYIVMDTPCNSIASFDLHTESFSIIEFPKFDDTFTSHIVMLLTELGGCLCVMVNYRNDNPDIESPDENENDNNETNNSIILERADLWVMKEHGNKDSWFRLYSFCQPYSSFGCNRFITPIVYSKDGGSILLKIDTLKFGWYDLESNKFDTCAAHGLPNEPGELAYFVGSLVSLEHKLPLGRTALPRKKKKKNDLDNFLSTGFKLRL